MCKNSSNYNFVHRLTAWAVHLFTASAACVGILTLEKIYQHAYKQALWLMAITVVIDAIDGTFARKVQVKKVLPHMDGTLLDNIVDYVNYVITPSFFLLVNPGMLPTDLAIWIIIAITITSSYQFCQDDAKTPDHFFKGFPCFWNFAVFYMFITHTTAQTNAILIIVLCIMIFIPIKYVYPSRLDYLTRSIYLKSLMHVCSTIYGIACAFLLWHYPESSTPWVVVSLGYILLYLSLSIYRTFKPL